MQREEEKRGKYRRRRNEEEIGENEGKGRWKMKETGGGERAGTVRIVH